MNAVCPKFSTQFFVRVAPDDMSLADEHDGARLDALRRSRLLDSQADERFDRVTQLVALALSVPVALISLVDRDRQFFKSAFGLPEPWASCRETPLSHSFCQHVVSRSETLRIEDARTDPLVAGNGAVRDLNVVAYLGVPLRGPDGHVLGSLCAIDNVPRAWSDRDEKMMRQFAAIVEEQIGLASSADHWKTILNTMPQMVWSTLPDGFHDFYNDRWYEFTGMPHGSTDGEGWNGMFHADDQERAWEKWRHSLATGDLYEIEYRLRHASGAYRWTLGRALPIRGGDGAIERWFGTCTDIHDLKESETARDLISHELAHRIQNIFAVVTSLINTSARGVPEARPFADAVGARILALGQAHRYVKIDGGAKALREQERTLHGLMQSLLAPYQGNVRACQITISGCDGAIDLKAATALALILHELATNSVKYGALASEGGSLTVECSKADGDFQIFWRERGGPEVTASPDRMGFGSRLISTMMAQLRGSFERAWDREGLTATITFPESSLSRSA